MYLATQHFMPTNSSRKKDESMFAHSCLSESLEKVSCRSLMEEYSCDLPWSGSGGGGDVGDKQVEDEKRTSCTPCLRSNKA